MFKGLRTKIESEQKGQINSNPRPQVRDVKTRVGLKADDFQDRTTSESATNLETQPNTSSSQPNKVNQASASPIILREELPATGTLDRNVPQESDTASKLKGSGITPKQSTGDFCANQEVGETADALVGHIAKLRAQLRTVIKERDEINEQRDQSYQLIGALEKNLERHKETNTSLESKLAEYESRLKDQRAEILDKTKSIGSSVDGTFSKSFNPKGHFANASDTRISDNAEVLRHEIIELQAQLAKKNRQLKIRQQNLIDMKKTLQKEILDHGRTRDELAKLQKQLKNYEVVRTINDPANDNHAVSESNMDDQTSDLLNLKHDVQQYETPSNPKQVDNGHATSSPQAGNIGEDTISLNATIGNSAVQFDRISYLSRSSASVDDFESNDLQHSNNNKELSHEYLRNVLFRYMTSTDTETTQHLVKAISVLMDFTPEQLAAIKSSMNGRVSSWLRLK